MKRARKRSARPSPARKSAARKKQSGVRAKSARKPAKRRTAPARPAKPAAGRIRTPQTMRAAARTLGAPAHAAAPAAAAAPEQTLLIPGTQATCLEDANGTVIYNAVRVSLGLDRDVLGGRPKDEWVPLLSMKHTPGKLEPDQTSLEPGTRISVGKVVHTPYDHIEAFVQDFPYDWRGDLRLNAGRLLQFLGDERPAGGGRWNLIGHSQGGMLIVLASKLAASPDAFSRLVARVVLVGAPLAGTMQATRALFTGRDDLGPGMQEAARDIGRTWPALYQMLPSWNAVLDPNGNPLPADQQLTQPGGWPNQAGIQADLLLRARETQALLTGPFSHMGPGTAVRAIMGEKQDTPATLVRDGNGLNPGAMRNEPGDSLVPFDRTLQWGGTPFASHAMVFDGKVNPHAMLCEDGGVVTEIQKFLAQPAPPPPTP